MDKRKRISKRSKRLRIASILSLVLILGTFLAFGIMKYIMLKKPVDLKEAHLSMQEMGEGRIYDDLLTPNEFSRPQIPLAKVNGVVIHYTANPGTNAKANRNYFNNLPEINQKKDSNTYASSNYIIDLDGKILRIVPETEMAYASNERNEDTLSIECCYSKEDGSFTSETYDSLVWLVTTICKVYRLESEDVIRHYDVSGKNCPKYYVENERAWISFRQEIDIELQSK